MIFLYLMVFGISLTLLQALNDFAILLIIVLFGVIVYLVNSEFGEDVSFYFAIGGGLLAAMGVLPIIPESLFGKKLLESGNKSKSKRVNSWNKSVENRIETIEKYLQEMSDEGQD